MSIYILQNEFIRVSVNSFGANLTSIFDKKKECELLWQADIKSWNQQDICIFPFVARLKDGFYFFQGKKYEMPIHGFCKFKDFFVVKQTSEYLEMTIAFDEQTLSMYPFKFKFTAKFELILNKLKVTYLVQNLDSQNIYYGIGGHPGFILDGLTNDKGSVTNDNFLVFEKNEFAKVALDDSNFFVRGKEKFTIENQKINLSKDIFANDAIILYNDFGKVLLKRKNSSELLFETNSTYLAFWSHAKFGEYVCIEPWWTLPDDENPERELNKKSSVLCLSAGDSAEYIYSVSVLN